MTTTKRRRGTRAVPDPDPPYLYPEDVATRARAPRKPMVVLPHGLTELPGPALGTDRGAAGGAAVRGRGEGEARGERIIVRGRVLDTGGRPVPTALVEVWQA